MGPFRVPEQGPIQSFQSRAHSEFPDQGPRVFRPLFRVPDQGPIQGFPDQESIQSSRSGAHSGFQTRAHTEFLDQGLIKSFQIRVPFRVSRSGAPSEFPD
jgi:hypothetical protein